MRSLLVLLVPLLNSAVAFGHPGHGTPDPSSLNHYLTSPTHVGSMVGCLALVVVLSRLLFTGRCHKVCKTKLEK